MQKDERPLARGKDLLIIGAVLLLALGGWGLFRLFSKGEGIHAEIYFENRLVKRVDFLNGENRTFSVSEKPDVVFEVKDGAIGFASSSCPDKICVHSGFLNQSGQSAACLPNHLVLKIVSDEGSGADVDITLR